MVSDRFDHLFFCPRDFDASRNFYVELLGWQVVSEWTDNHGRRRLVVRDPDGNLNPFNEMRQKS